MLVIVFLKYNKFNKKNLFKQNNNYFKIIFKVLSEVGPAILISVLTNLFADGVGAFTSSPEITLLCVGNMISMAVAFLFQVKFFI